MYFIYIVIIKFYIIDYKNQFKFNNFYKKIKCNIIKFSGKNNFYAKKKKV